MNLINYTDYCSAVLSLKRAGKKQEALEEAIYHLNQHPDNPYLLYFIGLILREDERLGEARVYLSRSSALAPTRAEPYVEMARTFKWPGEAELAEECYKKAESIDPNNVFLWVARGMGEAYGKANPVKAREYLQKALDIEPDNIGARDAMGITYLYERDWEKGWDGADALIGHCPNRSRRVLDGCKAVPWDGKPTKKLHVYGEQGLGDEIMFASCIPDALGLADEVIIECHPRLENLFRYSFLSCRVYGTLNEPCPEWYSQHEADTITASCAMGELPKFLRRTDESFKGGQRYLYAEHTPVMEHVRRWTKDDSLYHIGIAWTGGMLGRPWERVSRCIPLPFFMEPISKPRRQFVSLEYNSSGGDVDGYPIIEHPDASADDVSRIAALVASLNLVVCVPTTVMHIAGGLGVECICIVPEVPSWRFGLEGDGFPWHKSVTLVRQQEGEPWEDVMIRVEEKIDAVIRRIRATT